MSASNKFEHIRDTYFVNPKSPNVTDLVEATAIVMDGFANPDEHDFLFSDKLTPLHAVGRELTKDYRGDRGTREITPRRFNHLSVAQLHPSDNMIGVLAHTASTLYNNNTIIGEVSPLETEYENKTIKWLLENIAGYDPDKASGSLVSGGTSANQTALTVAREILEEEGWKGRRPVQLFTSEMAHYSVSKVARMLAPYGMIRVNQVPLNDDYTMDVDALARGIKSARWKRQRIMGIVAVAGQTETGLIDDISTIAQIADDNNIYLHVDGAYGAPYILSRAGERLQSVKDSRSYTCDPHKYLYVPYSSGSVMFASSEDHARIEIFNEGGGDYMYKSDEAKLKARQDFIHNTTYLGKKRLEGSMGGQSAAALQTTITHIGREGLALLLDHNLDMAERFADGIVSTNPALRLSFQPQLNTVCVEPSEYHSRNDERVELVSAALDRKGIYLASTSLATRGSEKGEKHKVLRFVATHPYTDNDDVDHIVESMNEAWKETE